MTNQTKYILASFCGLTFASFGIGTSVAALYWLFFTSSNTNSLPVLFAGLFSITIGMAIYAYFSSLE